MKCFLSAWVLALALSMVPSMAPAMDTGEPLAKKESASMVAGRKAVEAKDFKSAVGHFTKAVDTEPKNADAYSMLGYSYRKTGTVDKSLEFYQKALKLDAHHRGAREYLGELYLDMNQPDNAEKQLAALKKDCSFLSKCEEYDDLKKAVDAYKAKKK